MVKNFILKNIVPSRLLSTVHIIIKRQSSDPFKLEKLSIHTTLYLNFVLHINAVLNNVLLCNKSIETNFTNNKNIQ